MKQAKAPIRSLPLASIIAIQQCSGKFSADAAVVARSTARPHTALKLGLRDEAWPQPAGWGSGPDKGTQWSVSDGQVGGNWVALGRYHVEAAGEGETGQSLPERVEQGLACVMDRMSEGGSRTPATFRFQRRAPPTTSPGRLKRRGRRRGTLEKANTNVALCVSKTMTRHQARTRGERGLACSSMLLRIGFDNSRHW